MKYDTLKIVLAFLATFLLVYLSPQLGLPQIINQFIFLALIAIVFFAKDDILWLTWFFIILDTPGHLFASQSAYQIYRLPFYNLASGISLGFQELFVLMYLIKFIKRKGIERTYAFTGYTRVFLGLGLFYFLISFGMGISVSNIITTVRALMAWLWILILPAFIKDEKDMHRVFVMLIPFVFLAFLSSVQTFFTGRQLSQLLSRSSGYMDVSEEGLIRVSSSDFIVFFSITQSLYYVARKYKNLNMNLLLAIIATGTLTIFFSATRGWIIGLAILLASMFSMKGFSGVTQAIRLLSSLVVVSVVLTAVSPQLERQLDLALGRVATIGALAEGDLTAEGTLSRITARSPRVMSAWRESPLIGWGFSDQYYRYADGHVGNQTNLLNLGILGFLLFQGIYFAIMIKSYTRGRKTKFQYGRNNTTLVYLFAMMALFFIHSTSGALWIYRPYGVPHAPQLFFGFLFVAMSTNMNRFHELSA